MKRVRIGVRVTLPFGLFKNAAIFVRHISAENAAKAQGAVFMLQEIFPGVPFVCDVEESNQK
jgi:hypothetical protein